MKTSEKIKTQMNVFGITPKDIKEELLMHGIIDVTQKQIKDYLNGVSNIDSEWLEIIREYLPDQNLSRFILNLECIQSEIPVRKYIYETLPKIDYSYFRLGIKPQLLDITDTRVYQGYIIDYLEKYVESGRKWRKARKEIFRSEILKGSVRDEFIERVKKELEPMAALGTSIAGLGLGIRKTKFSK